MDILTLRTELETLLVDELGTYVLANGAVTPAVAVRAMGEPMPSGTTVKGVEMILRRNADVEPIPAYRREVSLRRWQVYLVDWSGAGGLDQIAGRIAYAYPGSRVATLKVPEGVGPQNQVRVTITTGPDGLSDNGAT